MAVVQSFLCCFWTTWHLCAPKLILFHWKNLIPFSLNKNQASHYTYTHAWEEGICFNTNFVTLVKQVRTFLVMPVLNNQLVVSIHSLMPLIPKPSTAYNYSGKDALSHISICLCSCLLNQKASTAKKMEIVTMSGLFVCECEYGHCQMWVETCNELLHHKVGCE